MTNKRIYACLVSAAFIAVASAPPADGNSPADENASDESPIELDDVVVTGLRIPKLLKETPVQTRLITARDIALSDATDIRELLQHEMPGVEFTYAMNQQVHLNFNGQGGQSVLFLVDGERLAGETLDDVDFSRLDMSNVDHIEIVRGASSALYGSSAGGGVINIITKQATARWRVTADARIGRHNEQRYNLGLTLGNKFLRNILNGSHYTIDNYDVHSAPYPAARVFTTIYGNKIWNAYRLLNGWAVDAAAAQSENNRLAVAWFGQALGRSLRQIAEDFKSYRISEAFKEAYRLFWDDFSGLYLEMVKPAYGQPIDAPTFEATRTFFDSLMRVLHPFMPFVTEEIWQDLAPRKEGESITVAPMPQPDEIDGQLLARFELAREVISSVRNVRNQKNLPQKEALTLKVIADENYPAEYAPVMRKMANLTAIETVTEKDPAAAAFIVKTTQYFVPMAGKIDAEAERRKLTDELSYQEGFLASVMKKLSNERFMQSAPEKVVANERAKQADAEAKIAAIKAQLEALS